MSGKQDMADALGVTLEDLLEWERRDVQSKEAESLGIDVWELKMKKQDASAQEIEEDRARRYQIVKEVLWIE